MSKFPLFFRFFDAAAWVGWLYSLRISLFHSAGFIGLEKIDRRF